MARKKRGRSCPQRWSPKKFARALLDGKTQAEAAKIAGSLATTEEALKTQGYRWAKHPKVAALLAEADALLDTAWAQGVAHLSRVIQGVAPDTTHFDRAEAIKIVGKVKGKFVDHRRVEVEHKVTFRGFRPPRAKVIDAPAVPPRELPEGGRALPEGGEASGRRGGAGDASLGEGAAAERPERGEGA